MENKQWSWNYCNNEYWNHDGFDTKEEAILDAQENYEVKDRDIDVGQCKLASLPTYIDADNLFEKLNNQYGEDLSEYDQYLFDSVTDEQREELENELSDVMLKFYEKVGIKSNWYTIYNSHTVHVD